MGSLESLRGVEVISWGALRPTICAALGIASISLGHSNLRHGDAAVAASRTLFTRSIQISPFHGIRASGLHMFAVARCALNVWDTQVLILSVGVV